MLFYSLLLFCRFTRTVILFFQSPPICIGGIDPIALAEAEDNGFCVKLRFKYV